MPGRSIDMNQTAHISLQVPIMSNSTQTKTQDRAKSTSATPHHHARNLKPQHIHRIRSKPPKHPNNVPAAGEALSRQYKPNPQEGISSFRHFFYSARFLIITAQDSCATPAPSDR